MKIHDIKRDFVRTCCCAQFVFLHFPSWWENRAKRTQKSAFFRTNNHETFSSTVLTVRWQPVVPEYMGSEKQSDFSSTNRDDFNDDDSPSDAMGHRHTAVSSWDFVCWFSSGEGVLFRICSGRGKWSLSPNYFPGKQANLSYKGRSLLKVFCVDVIANAIMANAELSVGCCLQSFLYRLIGRPPLWRNCQCNRIQSMFIVRVWQVDPASRLPW